MVLQPPQAEVCSGSQSLDTSSRVAQLEAEIAQVKEVLRLAQQIGAATGLLAQSFVMAHERAGRVAADNADDKTVALLIQDRGLATTSYCRSSGA
jgi:predicted RNA methylase